MASQSSSIVRWSGQQVETGRNRSGDGGQWRVELLHQRTAAVPNQRFCLVRGESSHDQWPKASTCDEHLRSITYLSDTGK